MDKIDLNSKCNSDVTNFTTNKIQPDSQNSEPDNPSGKPNDLLTRNDVASYFQIDLGTVHNWTKKGYLKSYGIGRRVYYKRSEVVAAITPLR